MGLAHPLDDRLPLAGGHQGRRTPVLYMPAEVTPPQEVTALEDKCHVRVMALPRRIEKLADVRPEELAGAGVALSAQPYVVPGGRFNEMYGWDSYFIVLGLEAEHTEALAKGMVDNFLFEIEHYGAVLNANRTYYLTRSQPPFLTSMIRAVYENPASFAATPAGRAEAHAWLERAYTLAEKDYSTWTRPEHQAGTPDLARYFDYGSGPVPEMADDEHVLSRCDPLRSSSIPAPEARVSGEGLGASRCGRSGAAEADELRCKGQRGLHARMVRRLPAEPRFLRRRPRHARVRIRYQRPLRALLGRHASLRAGVPEQPALSL